jgi:hypothetical protein
MRHKEAGTFSSPIPARLGQSIRLRRTTDESVRVVYCSSELRITINLLRLDRAYEWNTVARSNALIIIL